MSEFPTLAKVLRDHLDITEDGYRNPYMAGHPACECGWEQGDASGIGPYWSDHVAEVWREACSIATFEDLYALPVGCIVRFSSGTTDEREKTGWCWGPTEHEFAFADGENALVIWHPDWSKA